MNHSEFKQKVGFPNEKESEFNANDKLCEKNKTVKQQKRLITFESMNQVGVSLNEIFMIFSN